MTPEPQTQTPVVHLLKVQHWTGRIYACGETLPREAYPTRDATKSTREPEAVTCPACREAMMLGDA